jgi:hypothetical protein
MQSTTPASERLPAGLSPIRDEEFGFDEARHLLLRAGFGGTPDQIRGLAALGARGAVDYLLDVGSVPFDEVHADAFDAGIMREPTDAERAAYQQALRSGDEDTVAAFRQRRQNDQARDRRQVRNVQRWWLERMIETPRPLEEKMTLFWHGHFATSYRTIENSYHMFRRTSCSARNALGSFADLMHEIIRDPAMLAYLDNNDNRKSDSPNENLARELMELFSLGVGNYTEQRHQGGRPGPHRVHLPTTTSSSSTSVRTTTRAARRILGSRGALDGEGFVARSSNTPGVRRTSSRSSSTTSSACTRSTECRTTRPRGAYARSRSSGDTLRANAYEVRPTLRKLFLSRHFYHPAVVGERIKSPVGARRRRGALAEHARARSWGCCERDGPHGAERAVPAERQGLGRRADVDQHRDRLHAPEHGELPADRAAPGGATRERPTTERFDPTPMLKPLAEADAGAGPTPNASRATCSTSPSGATPHERTRIDTLTEIRRQNGGVNGPAMITGMLLLIGRCPSISWC